MLLYFHTLHQTFSEHPYISKYLQRIDTISGTRDFNNFYLELLNGTAFWLRQIINFLVGSHERQTRSKSTRANGFDKRRTSQKI